MARGVGGGHWELVDAGDDAGHVRVCRERGGHWGGSRWDEERVGAEDGSLARGVGGGHWELVDAGDDAGHVRVCRERGGHWGGSRWDEERVGAEDGSLEGGFGALFGGR